jgi:aspartate kinase
MSVNNKIIVMKFGGTSQKFSTYQMIRDKISDCSNCSDFSDKKFVVVLSAISGITNKLLKLTELNSQDVLKEIIDVNLNLSSESGVDISDLVSDFISEYAQNVINGNLNQSISIVSKGEFFTANILNRYLNSNGLKSCFISSLDVIQSNLENESFYNKGEFSVDGQKILSALLENDVVVVPGFSGSTPGGSCCLLGRGGSDTTGSIIASAVNALLYEIWTDVNGIYTSDPRKVSGTRINNIIDYQAAQEVAAMGAKVIHPYCILPCASKSIPIHIKNTFNPTANTTVIYNNSDNNNVYAVTIQDGVKVFKITSLNMWNNYGFVYDIFSVFKENNVDINIINTSQFNITTTTDESDLTKLEKIKEKLEKKYQVELLVDNSIVSIVGDNIRLNKNISWIFAITKEYNIITTSYSSNDMSLSFVIDSSQSIDLTQKLHGQLFGNNTLEHTNIKL